MCAKWQWNALDWCYWIAIPASLVVQSSNTVSCVSLSIRTHPCVLAVKHPIVFPNRYTVWCLLWEFWEKIYLCENFERKWTALLWHYTVYYKCVSSKISWQAGSLRCWTMGFFCWLNHKIIPQQCPTRSCWSLKLKSVTAKVSILGMDGSLHLIIWCGWNFRNMSQDQITKLFHWR